MNKQNQELSSVSSHSEIENECARCHEPWQGVSADLCQSCHLNVADQRTANAGLHGRLPDSGQCSDCHIDHQGPAAEITRFELASFEHALLTDFSLVTHDRDFDDTTILCADCHPDGHYERWLVTCQECHLQASPIFTSYHSEFFGSECRACHDGTGLGNDINHQSIFPLDGAHSILECTDCHLQPILSGTPDTCFGCHQEPEVHRGQFGTDCVRCHDTGAWTPAHLSYHTFPLDHGRENPSDCQTCHRSNYQTYTCYSCHEHEPGEIRSEHIDEGISEFDDCISCHPTGHEEEEVESDDI